MSFRPMLIGGFAAVLLFLVDHAGAEVPRTADEADRIGRATALPDRFDTVQPWEHLPGGAATVSVRQRSAAFSQPSSNLRAGSGLDFELGKALFEKLWVASPASTKASDGLGPRYNARSCATCHINDGRGHPPEGGNAVSMVLRLSGAGGGPDPVLGTQLQDFAAHGLPPEGRVAVDWEEVAVPLAGGEVVHLRRPLWRAEGVAADLRLSPRVAPPMIGLGLLEAIPEANILALADPQDSNGDGISGRAANVGGGLGRFGWKAAMPTLRDQSADAFRTDMGLSTPVFPEPWGDCTEAQTACRALPHGDRDARGTEVDDAALDLVTFYVRNLAVPARADADDPQVLRGKALFHAAGCAACHRPAFVTARLPERPEPSFQLIWPYTDLLLHDMGEGLADHRPEADASGTEWRTPPLWGLGHTFAVSGHTQLLHDGRARSPLEAILWHGGEATQSRNAVAGMAPEDRADLIAFLESL